MGSGRPARRALAASLLWLCMCTAESGRLSRKSPSTPRELLSADTGEQVGEVPVETPTTTPVRNQEQPSPPLYNATKVSYVPGNCSVQLKWSKPRKSEVAAPNPSLQLQEGLTCIGTAFDPSTAYNKTKVLQRHHNNVTMTATKHTGDFCGGIRLEEKTCLLPESGRFEAKVKTTEDFDWFDDSFFDTSDPWCEESSFLADGRFVGPGVTTNGRHDEHTSQSEGPVLVERGWCLSSVGAPRYLGADGKFQMDHCRLLPLTHDALLETFGGKSILLIGDGHVRSMFIALMAGVRRQRLFVDAHGMHGGMQYSVGPLGDQWQAVDLASFPNLTPTKPQNLPEEIMKPYVKCDLLQLGTPCVDILFAWAPRFRDQVEVIEPLVRAVLPQVILASINNWDKTEAMDHAWLRKWDYLFNEQPFGGGLEAWTFAFWPKDHQVAKEREDIVRQWLAQKTRAFRYSILNATHVLNRIDSKQFSRTGHDVCGSKRVHRDTLHVHEIVAYEACAGSVSLAHCRAMLTFGMRLDRQDDFRLSALHLNTSASSPLPVEEGKTCMQDCAGTCSLLHGRCDCPPTFKGDTCSIPTLRSCQLPSGTIMPCKPPFTCACMQDCMELGGASFQTFCIDRDGAQDLTQLYDQVKTGPVAKFDFNVNKTHPVASQPCIVTNTLEPKDGGCVPRADRPDEDCNNAASDSCKRSIEFAYAAKVRDSGPWIDCGNPCVHGYCDENRRNTCQCFSGYSGAQCDQPEPSRCMSDCNDRGECILGTCKCDANYFGVDCSLSYSDSGELLLWDAPPRTPAQPSVYIYDLPPQFNAYFIPASPVPRHADQRFEMELLHERLLNSRHRTVDGPADLYFLPIAFQGFGDVADTKAQLVKAINFIKQDLPFWNETGGHRHLLVATNDKGGCQLELKRNGTGDPSNIYESLLANITLLSMYGYHSEKYQCFNPGQDVIIPDIDFTPSHLMYDHTAIESANDYLKGTNLGDRDRQTLVFAGEIFFPGPDGKPVKMWNDGETSNVRQLVHDQVNGKEGYNIYHSTAKKVNFWEFQTSKFCLSPPGMAGHYSRRTTQSILLGCIPVIVQDRTEQPFEAFLPYEEFSIRVSEANISMIQDILESISEQKLKTLQSNLACVRSRFYFSSILGPYAQGSEGKPDAFKTLLDGLLKRGHSKPEKRKFTMEELCGDPWEYRPIQVALRQPWMDGAGMMKEGAELYNMWNPKLPRGGHACLCKEGTPNCYNGTIAERIHGRKHSFQRLGCP